MNVVDVGDAKEAANAVDATLDRISYLSRYATENEKPHTQVT